MRCAQRYWVSSREHMSAINGPIYLAPGLLGPIASTLADAARGEVEHGALSQFLSRARYQTLAGTSTEALLAQLYPNAPAPGPLIAAAQGRTESAYYYRAAPVHLRADRDRLLLFAGQDLALDDAEANAIAEAFNQAFNADGLELCWRDGEGLMAAPTPPGPNLPGLFEVAGRYLDTVLPGEAASRPWRQLLNEVQMLLHEHPVNQARAQRGALSVNGLWIWAGGPAAELTQTAEPAAGHPLVRGLQVSGQRRAERSSQAPLTLWEAAAEALMAGDIERWLAALQAFEQTLGDALAQHPSGMTLLPGNGYAYHLDRLAPWRFWRRADLRRHWLLQ